MDVVKKNMKLIGIREEDADMVIWIETIYLLHNLQKEKAIKHKNDILKDIQTKQTN